MITGIVNFKGEALVRVVVGDLESQRIVIDSVIDTGYTGFLTLPPSTIIALELPWRGREEIILGDGSVYEFDVYSGRIIWDGEYRTIKIHESNTESLLGVGMLYGYELCIETIDGGTVKIKALEN